MTSRDKTNWGKAEWRRWAKVRRSQLDTQALSEHAVKQLERWPHYNQAEHVLTYLAFGSEIDLSGLSGKYFYVTRTRQDGSLTVHELTKDLERHPYGFLQPAADAPEVGLERLELLPHPRPRFRHFQLATV